jgi:hypothetical protein
VENMALPTTIPYLKIIKQTIKNNGKKFRTTAGRNRNA